VIAALLVTASLTANSFWRVDRLAGKLMLPYLVWLALANALNLNILQHNPSVRPLPAFPYDPRVVRKQERVICARKLLMKAASAYSQFGMSEKRL